MKIRGKIFDVVKTEAVLGETGVQSKFYLENLDLVMLQGDDFVSAYTGLIYLPLFDYDGALVAFKECVEYADVSIVYEEPHLKAASEAILDGDIAAFCKLCNKVATDAIEMRFEDVTVAVEDFCRFMSVDPDIIRAFTGGSLWYRTEV